jgi:sulfur carrier protein
MKLTVNGETRDFPDGATLSTVVAELTPATRGIAVAVNANVVPRGSWPSTGLRADDRIEVLTAVQGG